jgi:hypothetical protein
MCFQELGISVISCNVIYSLLVGDVQYNEHSDCLILIRNVIFVCFSVDIATSVMEMNTSFQIIHCKHSHKKYFFLNKFLLNYRIRIIE